MVLHYACIMLYASAAYYAENYASIIRQGLLAWQGAGSGDETILERG